MANGHAHPLGSALRSPRRVLLAFVWLLLAGLCFVASGARAQAIESVLAPGKLSTAHAKVEEDCQKCHVRFDRNAQDRLCMDCHRDVGQDTRTKAGFHGRMKPQACRSCHTEHKGRDARIAEFDKAAFDHAATAFALRGGHQKVDCAKCHVPGKGYRIAARDCVACHRKDDVHKGSLGAKCADCHVESNWKEAKFDHGTTRFALTGKHDAVKCESCHKAGQYKDTPRTCIACHKKDDKHKGQYGEKCDACHATAGWKDIRFNHDTETRFPLLGKHRATKCDSCHTGSSLRDKPPSACNDCHRKDDKHKGTLGADCARCHTERDWKEPAKFNHARTAFPLLGKHAGVQCKDCHKSDLFKEAPKACIGCHRKDDRHKGSLGENCEQCHNERDWKKTNFDHAKTAFPLLGGHQKAECGACHKSTNYKETSKDCFACHARDDKHQGQQGKACAQCHNEAAWKPAPKFDHGLSAFPLLGRHVAVECKACHVSTLLFKNAKSDCNACHAKDDRHKKALGLACEQCHNPRSWKAWTFSHDKQTKFPLDGKHSELQCASCHNKPTDGRVFASAQCVSCHAKDDAHDGSYGRQCQQCHVTTSFKTIRSRPGRPLSWLDLPRRTPNAGGSRVPS